MWGLVNYTRYKIGATWLGQPVQIVTTPGSKWRGCVYLYNDPSQFFVPPDPSKPGGLGAGGEGYWPFALGPDKAGNPWQLVALPDPPPGSEMNDDPTGEMLSRQIFWNFFAWPLDAQHQYVVQVTHGGYISYAAPLTPNDGYAAPAGAPFHPLYKHLTGRG